MPSRLMTGLCTWLLATSAFGQVPLCGGSGSARIGTTPLAVGTTVTFSVLGGASRPFAIFASDGLGITPVPGAGTACLNLASPYFFQVLASTLPGSGRLELPIGIPDTPSWLSIVYYVQGAVADPSLPSGFALTNTLREQFEHPDTWASITPGLQFGRAFASGTLLSSGWVLVAGGLTVDAYGAWIPHVETDLYVPLLRSFTPGPHLLHTRAMHTATTLLDGRVLLAGGLEFFAFPGTVPTSSCEIYDPATGTVVPAAPMHYARVGHSAALLPDGRVLVVGGPGFAGDVYDPASNAWTPTGYSMQYPHTQGTAVTLNDGRVLVISGISDFTCNVSFVTTPACDLYIPSLNGFVPAPPLPLGTGVASAQATLLDDGSVFVSGGATGVACFGPAEVPASPATYVFDGASWTLGPAMPTVAALHRQVLLENGAVLSTGGSYTTSSGGALVGTSPSADCLRFQGGTAEFRHALPTPACGHVAVRLDDGSVLVAGGLSTPAIAGASASASAFLYTPDP